MEINVYTGQRRLVGALNFFLLPVTDVYCWKNNSKRKSSVISHFGFCTLEVRVLQFVREKSNKLALMPFHKWSILQSASPNGTEQKGSFALVVTRMSTVDLVCCQIYCTRTVDSKHNWLARCMQGVRIASHLPIGVWRLPVGRILKEWGKIVKAV